jgi:hypothetical protein
MNSLIKTYLAGGFYGDWHKYVINRCDDEVPGIFTFLNPIVPWIKDGNDELISEEEKEETDKKLTQSLWWPPDKFCVRMADIVFVYFRDYRPKLLGVGEVFEIGMCFAWDKFTIVVNEVDHRYYRGVARMFPNFKTLKEGVDYLIHCAWVGGDM